MFHHLLVSLTINQHVSPSFPICFFFQRPGRAPLAVLGRRAPSFKERSCFRTSDIKGRTWSCFASCENPMVSQQKWGLNQQQMWIYGWYSWFLIDQMGHLPRSTRVHGESNRSLMGWEHQLITNYWVTPCRTRILKRQNMYTVERFICRIYLCIHIPRCRQCVGCFRKTLRMTCYLHPAVEKGEKKQKLNILESTSRRLVFNIPNTLQVTDFGQLKKIK